MLRQNENYSGDFVCQMSHGQYVNPACECQRSARKGPDNRSVMAEERQRPWALHPRGGLGGQPRPGEIFGCLPETDGFHRNYAGWQLSEEGGLENMY